MIEDNQIQNLVLAESDRQLPVNQPIQGYPMTIPINIEAESSKEPDQTKHIVFRNLLGIRVGQLMVVEKLQKRDRKGCVVWKCICDCGNTCEYSEDQLVNHKLVSCGCYRANVLKYNLNKSLHRMQGTCLERLCIKKARSDSKSGLVGIHITTNGRYRASIGFKGKRYNLGTFENLEDAIKARKCAERIHYEFIEEMRFVSDKKEF